jgi:hypothetical protein
MNTKIGCLERRENNVQNCIVRPERRQSGDEPHLRKQRPKGIWGKKSKILKEFHECTNSSVLPNVLTMVIAA